jgi:hypothetical protein
MLYLPIGAEVLLADDQGFPGSGPIFLATLGCLGDEASLLECYSFFPTGIHSCDHSRDVWIKCIGNINLYIYISGCMSDLLPQWP